MVTTSVINTDKVKIPLYLIPRAKLEERNSDDKSVYHIKWQNKLKSGDSKVRLVFEHLNKVNQFAIYLHDWYDVHFQLLQIGYES